MAVYVNSITFTNTLDNTPVNWLLANLGDEITIEHNISVKEYVLDSTANPSIYHNTDGYLPTAGSIWITGRDFSKFTVGDNIQLVNYATSTLFGTSTILEKLSDTEIRISGNPVGAPANSSGNSVAYSIITPVTALLYKWNFIENGEATNFLSKVDGTSQLAQITGLNAGGGGTNKPMTFIGGLEYQIGSIVVDEVSITNLPVYSSNFKIKHTTRVTPTMLSAQWDDLIADIKPDYFFNLNCLKAVFNYDARYFLTDPNHLQVLLSDTTLGNTGWFNENWNTNLTKYYKENLVYTDVATSTTVPKAQLKETNFEFYIRNTIDTPFVAGSTSLILNFAKAPYDESEYQLNGRDLKHNFVWETAKIKAEITPSAVNGSNYSDLSLRSLSNLKATFISSSSIKVTGTLTYGALGKAVFEESEEPRYMFWVAIQDHTKVGGLADRVNVKIDFNSFYYKSEFPNLITMNTKLIPHDYSDNYATTFPDRQKFAEDELTAHTSLIVQGDEDVTSVQLLRYTSKIQAYNSVTFESFDLESKTILLPATPVYFGFQSFNIVQAKPSIHVPSGEIIKNIVARSVTSYGAYEFAYPFLIRWEYWKELLVGNSFFFDALEPNNGINHDWYHYFTGNWKLRYYFELGTKINGVPAIYSNTKEFDGYNRNLSGENTTCNINTYDTLGNLLIDTSGKKYILGYANTVVKAIFSNGVDTFTGLSDNIQVVIGLEIFEQGGVNGKRRMSSKFVSDADTWFIPLSGETKVKLVAVTTTLEATCQIDYTKIASLVGNNKWKLTARVYGSAVSTSHGLILNGQNYLASQDVYMIATNPVKEETIVVEPKEMDCCSDFVWRVLADTTSDSEIKNDKTSFIYWFNKDAIERAGLFLIKPNGSSIALNGITTYGTPYDYGFATNGNNENLVGYLIDWKKVLTLLGEGIYQIKCEYETIFGASQSIYSKSFCLKRYTTERANGTVRIEYNLSGLLGIAKEDESLRDLLELNWYNQYRFDGVFHYNNSTYTSDEIQYQNGQLVTVEDEQVAEYSLKLKAIPSFKHDILRLDILMADEIMITDYNDSNIDGYFKKKVRKNGSYDPKWYPLASKLASIELKFKQAFNNLKKFRS